VLVAIGLTASPVSARDAYRCVVTRTIQIDGTSFSKATPKTSNAEQVYHFIEIDPHKGTAKLLRMFGGLPDLSPLSAFVTGYNI
jgi:hypothetical protein